MTYSCFLCVIHLVGTLKNDDVCNSGLLGFLPSSIQRNQEVLDLTVCLSMWYGLRNKKTLRKIVVLLYRAVPSYQDMGISRATEAPFPAVVSPWTSDFCDHMDTQGKV